MDDRSATSATSPWVIRPPRSLRERSAAALEAALGRPPTAPEIARRPGCDDDAVIEALGARVGRSLESREVLRLRFDEDFVRAESAARLGSSQVQVSRLLRASPATLHAYARAA